MRGAKDRQHAEHMLETIRAMEVQALQRSMPNARRIAQQTAEEHQISFGMALRYLSAKRLAEHEGVADAVELERKGRSKNLRPIQ